MANITFNYSLKHLSSVPAHLFRELRIGLDSYRNYLLNELNDVTQSVSSIMEVGLRAERVEDITPATTSSVNTLAISVPDPDNDGYSFTAQVDVKSFAKGFAGFTDEVEYVAKDSDGNPLRSRIPYTTLQQAIADKILSIQGAVCTIDAALKSGLNTQFDSSALLTAAQARGWEISSFISDTISVAGNGGNWVDTVKMLFESNTTPADSTYAYSFEDGAFTGASGLSLGLNAILQDFTGFFEQIEITVGILGTIFEQLWNAITNVFTYLVRLLIPDVLTDYQVIDNCNMEAFDLPFARFSVPIKAVTLNDIVVREINRVKGNSSWDYTKNSSPIVFGGSQTVEMSGKEITGTVSVHAFPVVSDYAAAINRVIGNHNTIIIPTGFGFFAASVEGQTLNLYAFYGTCYYMDIPHNPASVSFSPDTDRYTVNTLPVDGNEFTRLNRVQLPGSGAPNSEYVKAILGCEMLHNQNRFQRTFFGSEIESRIITDETVSPDVPADFISRWKRNNDSNVLLKEAMIASFLCSLCLIDTKVITPSFEFVGATVRTGGGSPSFEGGATVTGYNVATDDKYRGYYPYLKGVTPSFNIHSQTDAERGQEMKVALGKLAKTALLAGVAVAAIKIRKKIRVAGLSAQIKKNNLVKQLQEKVAAGGTVEYSDWRHLRRAEKAISRATAFGGVTLGTGAAAIIKDSLEPLTGDNLDSAADLSQIIYLLSGR